MKMLVTLLTLFLLPELSLAQTENSSHAVLFASDNRSSRTANAVVMMSVTDTPRTTVVPRCKGYEIQIVSGASIRFNSQGGPVTKSAGGIRIATGELYAEPNETTTLISAVVTDGATATIVIVAKY